MASKSDREKQQLEELINLQKKARASNWECPDCAARPLSSAPFAQVLLAEPGEDDICQTCAAKLEETGLQDNEDFVRMLRPRDTDTP